MGVITDETGHYQLINLPAGTHTLVPRYVGFKPSEKEVMIKAGETLEINLTSSRIFLVLRTLL